MTLEGTRSRARAQQGTNWLTDAKRLSRLPSAADFSTELTPEQTISFKGCEPQLPSSGSPVVSLTHIQLVRSESFQEEDFEELISEGQ